MEHANHGKEWNINFLQNKEIPNLCLILHILGNYRYVAEVTCKEPILF